MKHDKKTKFPAALLEEWDKTCKEIQKHCEKVAEVKKVKTLDTMTDLEIAEYIAEQLCTHSARRKDSKINIVHKALMDLRRGVRE